MDNIVLDPTLQVSAIQQCLSGGKRPIGLFLGAGCPTAIRGDDQSPLIPDVEGITRLVEQHMIDDTDLTTPFRAVHEQLSVDGCQQPTVEDMLTHIRALRAVAGSDTVRDLSADQLDRLDVGICDLIHQCVNKELPNHNTPYHSTALWAHAIHRDYPVEIFTTNYDMLIEQAFDESRVPYFDGFPGGRKPFFDPFVIEPDAPLPHWTRLWKLHGSINWYQNDSLEVFRGTVSEQGRRRVIHPSHLKYLDSRRLPYLAMLDRMRSFLRLPAAVLLMCGYSFRDEHINETIMLGLQRAYTTVVFALMYGTCDKYDDALNLARKQSNLNVLARDGGIIGGRHARWVERDREIESDTDNGAITWAPVVATDPNSKFTADFHLGDFQILGKLLMQLVSGG